MNEEELDRQFAAWFEETQPARIADYEAAFLAQYQAEDQLDGQIASALKLLSGGTPTQMLENERNGLPVEEMAGIRLFIEQIERTILNGATNRVSQALVSHFGDYLMGLALVQKEAA